MIDVTGGPKNVHRLRRLVVQERSDILDGFLKSNQYRLNVPDSFTAKSVQVISHQSGQVIQLLKLLSQFSKFLGGFPGLFFLG